MPAKNLLIILGATASGKTNLAVNTACKYDGEIISADSRQVFKGMDIGTGKDLAAYNLGHRIIPYHLIDHKFAGDRYQVNSFKNDFYTAFEDITARQKLPILCGGTGMYIHSVLQNHQLTAIPVNIQLREQLVSQSKDSLQKKLQEYPPHLTAHADNSSAKRLARAIEVAEFLMHHEIEEVPRPVVNPLVIGLFDTVENRREKILKRLNYRLDNGLVEEVENLILSGVSEDQLIFYGLEYKFVVNYLQGAFDFDTLREKLGIAICQYAKRQMTFFRKMEKDGVVINWLQASTSDEELNAKVIEMVEQEFDLK